jgi:hypothetical protein
MQAAWVIRYLSGLYVTGIRGCVHIISGVTAMLVVTCFAQRNAVLSVAQVFGVLTKAASMVYVRCEALTPHTVPDSLTYDVVRKEPRPKVEPASSLVQAAQFIVTAFSVHTLVVLLKVWRAVSTGTCFHQCWATNAATCFVCLLRHNVICFLFEYVLCAVALLLSTERGPR